MRLIDSEQLEIASPAWAHTDETVAYYEDIINTFTLGQRFVTKNFKLTSNVAISLNSKGNSMSMAYLYGRMGFDYVVIQQENEKIQENLREKNTLEILWSPQLVKNPDRREREKMTQRRILYGSIWDHASQYPLSSICAYPCRKYSQEKLDKLVGELLLEAEIRVIRYLSKQLLFLISDEFLVLRELQYDVLNLLMEKINESALKYLIVAKHSTFTQYVEDMYQIGDVVKFPEKTTDTLPVLDEAGDYLSGIYSTGYSYKFLVR